MGKLRPKEGNDQPGIPAHRLLSKSRGPGQGSGDHRPRLGWEELPAKGGGGIKVLGGGFGSEYGGTQRWTGPRQRRGAEAARRIATASLVTPELAGLLSGRMGVGRTRGWGPAGRRLGWGLRGGRGSASPGVLPGSPSGRPSPHSCPPSPGASPAPAGLEPGLLLARPRQGCQEAKQECLSNSKEVLPLTGR